MRLIASPIKAATLSSRIFFVTRTASVARMLSVITSSSSGLALTLATAPADSTPWVT